MIQTRHACDMHTRIPANVWRKHWKTSISFLRCERTTQSTTLTDTHNRNKSHFIDEGSVFSLIMQVFFFIWGLHLHCNATAHYPLTLLKLIQSFFHLNLFLSLNYSNKDIINYHLRKDFFFKKIQMNNATFIPFLGQTTTSIE